VQDVARTPGDLGAARGHRLFWGEMHTHTFCGDSIFGEIETAADIASTHLDFWAPGEHCDNQEFDWPRLLRAVNGSHRSGEFVAFAGLERAGADGDYNAYFLQDDPDPYTGGPLDEFLAYARAQGAVVIPHHTAYAVDHRGTHWERHDPELMPLAEIFSMHGCSERDDGPYPMDLAWMGPRASGGAAVTGLALGKCFGFIASSDGHNAYPGAYPLGLVGCFASELTRESLFEAFRARRTYAVTGDRIRAEFTVDGHLMGDVFTGGERRAISLKIEGLDALDKVEVVRNGRVLRRLSGALDREYPRAAGRYQVRLGWGWGGAGTNVNWTAELRIEDGEILAASPCFSPPAVNRIEHLTPSECVWVSRTGGYDASWTTNRYRVGGDQSIVFTVGGDPGTRLRVTVNGRHLAYSLGELARESRVEFLRGAGDERFKFHHPLPESQYRLEAQFEDDRPATDCDWYYVRVAQDNGQMAWLSPIWVRRA